MPTRIGAILGMYDQASSGVRGYGGWSVQTGKEVLFMLGKSDCSASEDGRLGLLIKFFIQGGGDFMQRPSWHS